MAVLRRCGDSESRKARYKKGWVSEWVAGGFLVLKGYNILHWRYRVPAGEIDLIARRGRLIAFVEVKARKTFDEALWTVRARQRQRMYRAAELWMQKHSQYHDYDRSFDLVAVVPWKGIRHHRQFFTW